MTPHNTGVNETRILEILSIARYAVVNKRLITIAPEEIIMMINAFLKQYPKTGEGSVAKERNSQTKNNEIAHCDSYVYIPFPVLVPFNVNQKYK